MDAHAGEYGNAIKKRLLSFAFEKTPCISPRCKLVSVQYREYEYGLLSESCKDANHCVLTPSSSSSSSSSSSTSSTLPSASPSSPSTYKTLT